MRETELKKRSGLTKRKEEILKTIIDAFITTGEPVGSKAVMLALKNSCSSATIRNEMNEMEKMGLLEQPHTSAGRVPTGRGYRIYVDSLMEEYTLSFEETLLLNTLLSDQIRDTEKVLSDLTKLLSRMTGYTVATFMRERTGTVERFEGVFIGVGSFLLVMITSSGKAVTKQFLSELPLTPEGVQSIIKVLNDHLTKKELGSVTLERVIAMEKDLGSYRAMIGPLIQIIYDMVAKTGDEHIVVKGLSNLLSHSEFIGEDADRSLFLELEDEEKLALRFREGFPDRIRIHIASEGNGLDRASFVTCPFRLRGNLEGAVCIIGPKRMNYGKAVARLEYLANQIHAASGFESPFPLIETKET